MLGELTKEQAEELREKVTSAFRGEFPFNCVVHIFPFPPSLFEKTDKMGAICRPVDFDDLVEWACWLAKQYGRIRAAQQSSGGGDRVYLDAWEPRIEWRDGDTVFKISTGGCVVESLAVLEEIAVPAKDLRYVVPEGEPYPFYESKGEERMNLEEGKVVKGGTNPPNTSDKRPPAPQGNGSKREMALRIMEAHNPNVTMSGHHDQARATYHAAMRYLERELVRDAE